MTLGRAWDIRKQIGESSSSQRDVLVIEEPLELCDLEAEDVREALTDADFLAACPGGKVPLLEIRDRVEPNADANQALQSVELPRRAGLAADAVRVSRIPENVRGFENRKCHGIFTIL
mgnify:CR=1 FL=1